VLKFLFIQEYNVMAIGDVASRLVLYSVDAEATFERGYRGAEVL
jgi:hypothetical protein